jgi:hypothetical protein
VDDSVGGVREFWLFGQVPPDAADGAYTLDVIARTDDALPAWQQVSNLMWVGDWVALPGPAPDPDSGLFRQRRTQMGRP